MHAAHESLARSSLTHPPTHTHARTHTHKLTRLVLLVRLARLQYLRQVGVASGIVPRANTGTQGGRRSRAGRGGVGYDRRRLPQAMPVKPTHESGGTALALHHPRLELTKTVLMWPIVTIVCLGTAMRLFPGHQWLHSEPGARGGLRARARWLVSAPHGSRFEVATRHAVKRHET